VSCCGGHWGCSGSLVLNLSVLVACPPSPWSWSSVEASDAEGSDRAPHPRRCASVSSGLPCSCSRARILRRAMPLPIAIHLSLAPFPPRRTGGRRAAPRQASRAYSAWPGRGSSAEYSCPGCPCPVRPGGPACPVRWGRAPQSVSQRSRGARPGDGLSPSPPPPPAWLGNPF
jgi:hypothetical protein